jgi:hypothetical protein
MVPSEVRAMFRLLIVMVSVLGFGAASVGAQVMSPAHAFGIGSQVVLHAERAPAVVAVEARAIDTPRGPSVLMQSLYAVTAGVQVLDAHSTFRALDAGGLEGNPLVGSLAERRPAFVAFKVGVAAALIYSARSMSKSHKVRAAITLALINGAYVALIHNNYRVAQRMRAAGAVN